MGSGQSSTDKNETYAIDSNGKIARLSRSKPKQAEEAPAAGTRCTNDSENNQSEPWPDLSLSLERKEVSSSQKPSATPINMKQNSEPSDQLRLDEIDDILNRMKAKYKPNSTEMAGKNKSVFEDIENRLLHCYRVNKDQALKCATLAEEYRSYVEKQRARILLRSAKA